MKKKFTPFLLLLPFLILCLILGAGLINGVLQAMGYIPAYGLRAFTPAYFIRILKEKTIFTNIALSLYIAGISSVLAIILAVLISFSLVMTKKDRGLLYGLIKIPLFVPWMVTAFLMVHLFSGSGFLARIFHGLGLERLSRGVGNLLYSPGSFGIIAAFVWACTPFACFFILTMMSGVSKNLGEAAENLGANTFQLLAHIYLPLCRPSIRNAFVIIFLSVFGNYEIPLLLGMTAPRALPVEIYYEYNHYDLRNRPYAMALNTVMLFISLLLAALAYGKPRKKKRPWG